MPSNFFEELVAEWYQLQEYFIRRNVLVGKLSHGGYECELDIVAFHPSKNHLVHIEPSSDADSWSKRESRYKKKFDAGRRYIPKLFKGLDLPETIDQIALFVAGSKKNHPTIGGGQVKLVSELMEEIFEKLKTRSVLADVVPEKYPILRGFQFVVKYRSAIFNVLNEQAKQDA